MSEDNHSSQNNAHLDPATSPNALNNLKQGVRKVNNLPIWITIGVIVFIIIVLMITGAQKKSPSVQQKAQSVSHQVMNGATSLLDGKQEYGTVAAYTPPPPLAVPTEAKKPEEPIKDRVAPTDDTPPLPPRLTPSAPSAPIQAAPEDENLLRAEQAMHEAKLSQFQEGLKSHSNISISMPRSEASAKGRISEIGSGSTARTQNEIASLQQKIPHNEEDDSTTENKGSYKDFDSNGSNRWDLGSKMESPKRYMLRTGAIIPATLISGINSELPGQINAQVSQNVYDTATGNDLLIPQGSRLVGAYNNQISYGQNRILIAWQRIIFPDGKALDIGAMPGAGLDGYAGLEDQVNHHFLRLFGSALLMSGITAGINYTQNQQQGGSNGYNQNSSSVLSQSLGQGLGQAMIQLFNKNLNVSPTLEIRPGFALNVMVSKDLAFSKPYQNFDY